MQLVFHHIFSYCPLLWKVMINRLSMPDKTLLTRLFPLLSKGACILRIQCRNCDIIYGSRWILHRSCILIYLSPSSANIQCNLVLSYLGFSAWSYPSLPPLFSHAHLKLAVIIPECSVDILFPCVPINQSHWYMGCFLSYLLCQGIHVH